MEKTQPRKVFSHQLMVLSYIDIETSCTSALNKFLGQNFAYVPAKKRNSFPEVFYKNVFLKNCRKINRKKHLSESLFNKISSWSASAGAFSLYFEKVL